jgi:glycine cleavage system T protein (aminomethyltransferase)
MSLLALHDFHVSLGAQFAEVKGMEAADHYGDPAAEQAALRDTSGVLDLSFRGRLCLTGADRKRFLNGQVTNNVKDLATGEGCYAALVTPKAKFQSDVNIYILPNEILLDFEPGLSQSVTQRLEKYIIAEDVQVMDVAPHYGLLSVQGPKPESVVASLSLGSSHPIKLMSFAIVTDPILGEIYCVNQPRLGTKGFDLFVPTTALRTVAEQLIAAAKTAGGRACGWRALETARIEAGIPRYDADMDETNLAPEAGMDARMISYTKGCYIGQEVIARIRTYGQVARTLRGLRLADDLKRLPNRGDKLFRDGKEVGYVTSAVASPTFKANLALGYVRREHNEAGTELILQTAHGESHAQIVELPFKF